MRFKYKLKSIYYFFRYNLWRGIGNLYHFFPEVFRFRSWEADTTLPILRKSLLLSKDTIHKYGDKEGKEMIVYYISEALDILNNIIEDKYLDIAEKELGYELKMFTIINRDDGYREAKFSEEDSESNMNLINYSEELKAKEWNRLWDLIRGTDEKYTGIDNWWD